MVGVVVSLAGWRGAWNNDLQGVWLESGVNSASPGRYAGDQALARLAGQVFFMIGGAVIILRVRLGGE
jgi:hypothetical protein